MKRIILTLTVAAMLCGCNSLGPVVTQTAVFVGVSAAIQKNPNLVPAAKVGAEVICAVAGGTNANPATLVASLDAAGPWSFEEWALLNGVVITAVNIGANSGSGKPKPYLDAACAGMNMAVAGAPANAPTERTVPQPSASLKRGRPVKGDPKWPQMK